MVKRNEGRVIPVQVDSPAAAEEEKQEQSTTPEDHAGLKPEAGEKAGPPQDLAELLKKKEEECSQTYDRLLRQAAEFENYKKRIARENEDFRNYAVSSFAKDLLPVLDNLERALQSAEAPGADVASLAAGVSLTRDELMKVLEKYGVTCVESLGCQFNPNFHQAMCTEPCMDAPDNTVIREMQKGYTMKDRLLRPSLVVVSTGGKKDA
ncbi:MAG: nucleotide exchange factor GrpE [Thermodesulfobacteriota bacterium]